MFENDAMLKPSERKTIGPAQQVTASSAVDVITAETTAPARPTLNFFCSPNFTASSSLARAPGLWPRLEELL